MAREQKKGFDQLCKQILDVVSNEPRQNEKWYGYNGYPASDNR